MNYVVDYIYTLALPAIAVKVLRESVFFRFRSPSHQLARMLCAMVFPLFDRGED